MNVGALEYEGTDENEGLLLGIGVGPGDGIILGGGGVDGMDVNLAVGVLDLLSKLPTISFSTLAQNSASSNIFCFLAEAKITCRLSIAKRRQIG